MSHWSIPAPVERVWDLLADVDTWPRWWPGVAAAHGLRQGDVHGVGGVTRLVMAPWPAWRMAIDVEVIEALLHEQLRARLHGRAHASIDGEGLWLLRGEGATTKLTCVWRVKFARGWLRRAVPLATPLLRWRHGAAMRAGERGLIRHLGSA